LPRNKLDHWDYGYAVTCETAQGSEFDNVIVFEPSDYWKTYQNSDHKRWLYTAITRARHKLIIVG
jgi:exodeoxyribonuclease-5